MAAPRIRSKVGRGSSQAPKIPAKRGRGTPSTLSPARLGTICLSILQGDTVKASCATALVPEPTYYRWRQVGERAVNEARGLLGEEDIEGAIWEWLEEGGGLGTAGPDSWYWKADAPDWWPEPLLANWLHAVFVIVVIWARGRSEQIYRATITKAAQGDPRMGIAPDWKAAQFMLTHSFGWRSSERIEVTGADGGPIDMQASEDQVLAALAALARKQREIEG